MNHWQLVEERERAFAALHVDLTFAALRRREATRAEIARLLAFARYEVQEGAGDCGEDTPYAVVDTADGEVESCHSTQAEADAAAAELEGSDEEDTEAASLVGAAFHAVLCVEGMDTGDGRILDPDGGTWRNLPLPYMAMDENSGGGHMGARLAGRWEEIERVGRRLVAHGHLLADDFGTRVEGLIREQFLRYNSIDVGDAEVEWEVLKVTEEGWPLEERARFVSYEVMGSTGCPFPALSWAVVWLDGMEPPAEFTDELPAEDERVTEPEVVEDAELPAWLLYANDPARRAAALEAHRAEVLPALRRPLHEPAAAMVASGAPQLPPPGYFDEHPDVAAGYFPDLRVDPPDEHGFRRVYGYVAPWGVCHIGIPQECTTAPPSASRYAYFATGSTVVACDDCPEGRRIPTAVLTYGTGHAAKVAGDGRPLSATDAIWHYDHTGSRGANVAVGENAFGIWVSGIIRADVESEAVRVLDGSNLSGDWRGIGGHLEMIAALAVNVPGFVAPPTSTYITASGEQTVLIASAAQGRPRQASPRDYAVLQRELAQARAELAEIRPLLPALRRLAAEHLERELLVVE